MGQAIGDVAAFARRKGDTWFVAVNNGPVAKTVRVELSFLGQGSYHSTLLRDHAEADIAAEHCLAPSFHATRWDRIVECYALLERSAPSALHTLNRAVALAEWHGPREGLAMLEVLEPPSWIAGS